MSTFVKPAANDNSPFSADMSALPLTFLRAYQTEIFGWNPTKGNLCTIDLWNYPDATLISSNWQGQLTLRSDAFADPVTKAMVFVIKPHEEVDRERLHKHVDELPRIMAAHKAAAQAKAGSRPKMARWVFDGTVPEYFQLRYQDELRAWAHNLPKIGLTKHIVLREGTFSDLSPDEDLGAVLIQVTLKARIERHKGDEIEIVVSAEDEEQQRRIARHCEKLERNKVPARMVLVEPERPGVPFMPDRVT
jgi:hypothetical protein